jgi:hypothetical protein
VSGVVVRFGNQLYALSMLDTELSIDSFRLKGDVRDCSLKLLMCKGNVGLARNGRVVRFLALLQRGQERHASSHNETGRNGSDL